MLIQIPPLTNHLRVRFDVDQASRKSASSLDESELAWKIGYRLLEASSEVQGGYKQFTRVVVLIDRETPSAEFQEIGQHFRNDYLHEDEFKMFYAAPVKALAGEVTSAFSQPLSPLNMTVRELSRDMQLSKRYYDGKTKRLVNTFEDLEDS